MSSRSTTPSSQRKSPTSDAGVQVSVDDTAQDPRIEARNQMKQRTRDQSQLNSYQPQRRLPPGNRRQDNIRRSNYENLSIGVLTGITKHQIPKIKNLHLIFNVKNQITRQKFKDRNVIVYECQKSESKCLKERFVK